MALPGLRQGPPATDRILHDAPVRRQILELLHAGAELAGEIASRFEISRPAISRHLRVLREAGLVIDEVVGRQRLYRIDPAPLREIGRWIEQFAPTQQWQSRFDALETEVTRTPAGAPATRCLADHPGDRVTAEPTGRIVPTATGVDILLTRRIRG